MGIKKNWEEIGEYVLKLHELGLNYKKGAELFNIDVGDIYRYNQHLKKKLRRIKRFEIKEEENKKVYEFDKAGDLELEVEKEKSARIRGSIFPEQIEKLIIEYRKENPSYGYKRIEEYLKKKCFVVAPRKKIRELLKSEGLASVYDSSFDREEEPQLAKGSRRFEASYPRELYQMDVTYVYISQIPVLYLAVIIDDYSRFCVASRLCHDQRSGTMIDVLHEAVRRYGKPQKLLTDQGSNFYTWSEEQTMFQKYLDDMEIEHIVADPHSPQTLGKVERLNQTIQKELLHKGRFSAYEEARRAIEEYFRSYNYERVHQGIGGQIPSERFWGINGETSRIETELKSNMLDISRGYLVFKNTEHTLSVVFAAGGIQVFLDGKLLIGGKSESESNGEVENKR